MYQWKTVELIYCSSFVQNHQNYVHAYVYSYVCTIQLKVYPFTVYIPCFRDDHKDKDDYKRSVEYDTTAAEATSIQGSPPAVSYAATTQALSKDTSTGPALQYDYARTGPLKVRCFQTRRTSGLLKLLLSRKLVCISVCVCMCVCVCVSWAHIVSLQLLIPTADTNILTSWTKAIWPA